MIGEILDTAVHVLLALGVISNAMAIRTLARRRPHDD